MVALVVKQACRNYSKVYCRQ